MVNLIINQDVLFSKNRDKEKSSQKAYKLFLFTVIIYLITDVLWGILNDLHWIPILFADTALYFAAMGLSVLLWSQYVIFYLEEKNHFTRILTYTGQILFFFDIAVIMVNFFHPILFGFDADGGYHAGPARYFTLAFQILIYFASAVYTLSVSIRSAGSTKRRNLMIGSFGLVMVFALILQFFFPLMPYYSIGFLLGICLLHTFVVENEKEEYRKALEEALDREYQQKRELGSAIQMAYTDPLTGIKNKHAYIEAEEKMNQRIADRSVHEFAVMVFDLNGLKHINDTKGHDMGDKFIKAASKLICDKFKHCPVYRIGGDEFAIIMEGEDYENRTRLQMEFDREIDENLISGGVVVSSGQSDYFAGQDDSINSVFERADMLMYQRKRSLNFRGAKIRA